MRNAGKWAKMYAEHVGVLSPEELEAFAAAIQLDALNNQDKLTKGQYERLEKTAGEYSEDLFA
jgi:hypothetical protein